MDPNNASALRGLGYAYLQQKDFDHAGEYFRKAAERDGKDPRVHYYNALLMNRAGGHVAGAKSNEMKKELETAIALDPQLADAYSLLAYAQASSGEPEKGLVTMKKAVELSPRNETYQINLANMYMVNRKVDEAIALLRGLAGSGNHEVVSRANAALVQAENLKKQTAAREAEAREYQKDTEKATSLEQSSPDWHYNLGDALLSKGNLDSAIAEYRHAISLKPDFPEAHLNLGAALGHKRDLDGAIDEYREAIRLKPDLASAHLRLGDALVEKDNAGGGIAEYREAIRLKPDFVQAHRELGYELMFKGERVAALEELRKVLTFDPRDDVVRRDVEKLSLEAHDK